MDLFSLRLSLCMILYPIIGIQSTGPTTFISSVGGRVSLPCGLASIKSCSWGTREGQHGKYTPLVRSGLVTNTERESRLKVGQDCSLQFHHLLTEDGLRYTCENGATNSSVSLELLTITSIIHPTKIELQCYLNIYRGFSPCGHSGIQIKWLNEDNTEIKGDRFRIESVNSCFSKLFINTKMTDHRRKWRCQITDSNGVKTNISTTTTLPNGTEEVFAVVGESVSLGCDGKWLQLGGGGTLSWSLGESLLVSLSRSGGVTAGPQGGPGFLMNPDSSLVIDDVNPRHSGFYNCSLHNESTVISLNRIKLHTLEVTAEYASPQRNVTLTCSLTCEGLCEKYFNLTWTYDNQDGRQHCPPVVNNTLVSRLFLPDAHSNEMATCSVSREGARVAMKTWTFQPHSHSVPAVALLVPLLVLLLGAVGGGVYWFKRKRKRDAEVELANIGMQNHVYEDIQELGHEVSQQSDPPRRGVTSTNGFYDLLQAAN